MNRRDLLKGIIAAPAVIVTPGLLMPVRPFVSGGGILTGWDTAPDVLMLTNHGNADVFVGGDQFTGYRIAPGGSMNFGRYGDSEVLVRKYDNGIVTLERAL